MIFHKNQKGKFFRTGCEYTNVTGKSSFKAFCHRIPCTCCLLYEFGEVDPSYFDVSSDIRPYPIREGLGLSIAGGIFLFLAKEIQLSDSIREHAV